MRPSKGCCQKRGMDLKSWSPSSQMDGVYDGYDDLLLHSNVRWLSKGKVLERLWAIREEIKAFLSEQKSVWKMWRRCKKQHFWQTLHHILMSSTLSCRDRTTQYMIKADRDFQKKLEIFKTDLQGELVF